MKKVGGLMIALLAVTSFFFALSLAGCVTTASSGHRGPRESRQADSDQRVESWQVERLRRVMAPLLQAANHPRRLRDVRVGIVNDPNINAATAGGGEFYVTTGLLERANDDQLRGVLAHEIAHDDLGHVAKAQVLGAGLQLGAALLGEFLPASREILPIAGTLIARGYSRSEEYEADRHGVEILRRAGHSKEVLINSLTWIMRNSGNSGGDLFSTHPGTADRIEALRKMR